MHLYAASLAPALVMGVGAAFDFLAGSKRRAPEWMQRTGLEWLYRLASEPRRLSGRYGWTNSEFLCLLAWESSPCPTQIMTSVLGVAPSPATNGVNGTAYRFRS